MAEEIQNCFYRISAKALIWNEMRDKFLITEEDNGIWELPGGGIDWGESPQDSIIREIKEEMGLEVTSVKNIPAFFLTFKNLQGAWRSNIIYETEVSHLNFTPSSECVAIKFVSPVEVLQMKTFPNVQLLADHLKGSSK